MDSNSGLPTTNECPAPQSPVIDASHLFGAAKEILIELDGVRYRLRITRRGKLILQK